MIIGKIIITCLKFEIYNSCLGKTNIHVYRMCTAIIGIVLLIKIMVKVYIIFCSLSIFELFCYMFLCFFNITTNVVLT